MKHYLTKPSTQTFLPFFSLSLFACISISQAEEPTITEQNFLQDFPVVLSASRLQQPLAEAPNAMTVIDSDMIKASGFRTVAELFKLVPGMYVSFNTGYDPIVAYHGTTDSFARRMQVLVDGRAIHMPPIGSVAWENLPLHIDDIERIEVIRGPAAASHGGNSTQGVLNIITRDAGATPGVQVSATEGNGGISDRVLKASKRGETLDYRITAGIRRDEGYDANNELGANNLNNDSHVTRLFSLRGNYHPDTLDNFDFQLGHTNGSRGDGSNREGDPNFPHDRYDKEHFAQLAWIRSLDAGNEFKVQYYHIFQDVLNTLEPVSPLSDSYTNTRDDIEIQHTLQTSGNNRLVWGASLRRDWTLAPNRFLDEQTVQQTTLFAHDEWRMSPQWLLNTGAMQEDNGMGQSNLSPRVAVIYKAAEKQTLRFGLSKAYRNPSVYEERANYHFPPPIDATLYQSAGGLRPESVISREIGYLGEFTEQGLSVNARLYHDQVSDIIYETNPYPKNYVNLFDAEHDGIEVTTKHYWGERQTLTLNYAYQVLGSNFSGYPEVSIHYPGTPYTDTMPRNMLSALYSKIFARDIALSLAYYQQDTMLAIDRGPVDRQAFTRRWDMRIAKSYINHSKGYEAEIAFVVQGLTNESYIDYRNENKFNQRTFLTATLRY